MTITPKEPVHWCTLPAWAALGERFSCHECGRSWIAGRRRHMTTPTQSLRTLVWDQDQNPPTTPEPCICKYMQDRYPMVHWICAQHGPQPPRNPHLDAHAQTECLTPEVADLGSRWQCPACDRKWIAIRVKLGITVWALYNETVEGVEGDPPTTHTCEVPPDAEVSDWWRCPDCHRLWVVSKMSGGQFGDTPLWRPQANVNDRPVCTRPNCVEEHGVPTRHVDPQPAHRPDSADCPTPETGRPGDTWVCPTCGRGYVVTKMGRGQFSDTPIWGKVVDVPDLPPTGDCPHGWKRDLCWRCVVDFIHELPIPTGSPGIDAPADHHCEPPDPPRPQERWRCPVCHRWWQEVDDRTTNGPVWREVLLEPLDRDLVDVRNAVIAIAEALGAGLPTTPDVVDTLSQLYSTRERETPR